MDQAKNKLISVTYFDLSGDTSSGAYVLIDMLRYSR